MNSSNYAPEIQELILKIQNFRGVSPDEIIQYSYQLEEIGKKREDPRLIGYAVFSRAESYYLQNNLKNFYKDMLYCLPELESAEEWGYVVMANNMLGIMTINRGNASFAMDYFINALSQCQKYHLPDLEWIVQMNMGTLYLNIEDYQNAIIHVEKSLNYILSHQNMDGYVENLTVAYVEMAKAYLKNHDVMKASLYGTRLLEECMKYLHPYDQIAPECFFARLYSEKGMMSESETYIQSIKGKINENIPIMDVFDDLYDLLLLLLEQNRKEDFFEVMEKVEDLVLTSSVNNLLQKLVTLKLKFFRQANDDENYKKYSVIYFEISENMERENRMLVSYMIRLRNSISDLTKINREVEAENELLHEKSEKDALTGIANRFKLNEYEEEAFEEAFLKHRPFAIEILDIDFFKEYNDNYGHQAGDNALRTVANALKQISENGNIFAARYGGDEFVVIYEGYKKEQVEAFAESIKQYLYDEHLEHKYSKATNYVTVSQGLCWGIPEEHDRVYDFLHYADTMLYRVKEVSRNSIKIETYDHNFSVRNVT